MFLTKSYKIEEPKKIKNKIEEPKMKNTITKTKNSPEGISSDCMVQTKGSTNWKME